MPATRSRPAIQGSAHRVTQRWLSATLILVLVSITEAGAMLHEKQLYDFSDPRAAAGWRAVHDVVMGGVSSGGMTTTEEGTVVFEGRVSLENNGGFASIRADEGPWDLRGFSGILLRVRGDGQRYKLNLKTDASLDGVLYRVAFETLAGEWQTLRFAFDEFRASFRGRAVPGAPALDPGKIASIGVLISDKQAGPFRLEMAWIAAYRPATPSPA